MDTNDNASVTSRPLTRAEEDLSAWFEAQERNNIDTLESGARQIIALTTTFFGFLFGIVALGKEQFEASLTTTGAAALGALTVVLLLGGLLTALGVVMPRRYTYLEKRLDQKKAAYRQMIAAKTGWLEITLVLFGAGIAAFAGLIILMFTARL